MKKRFIAAIVSVCVMLGMASAPAVAVGGFIPITPYWLNVSEISFTMSRTSGTVNWSSTIYGLSGTTSITATYMLYKKDSGGNYTSLGTWNASSTTQKLTASGSATGAAGTYKITVTAKVTRNGTTETVDNSFEAYLS